MSMTKVISITTSWSSDKRAQHMCIAEMKMGVGGRLHHQKKKTSRSGSQSKFRTQATVHSHEAIVERMNMRSIVVTFERMK